MRPNPNRKNVNMSGTNLTASLMILMLMPQLPALAQDANELKRQQADELRKYMEAAGMSEEDIAKLESMYDDAVDPIASQQAADEERAQVEFEARATATGKATVSVAAETMEMFITDCVARDDGGYTIGAQAAQDNRRNSLWINSDAHYDRTSITLYLRGIGEFDIEVRPLVQIKDNRFDWSGIEDGGRGPKNVTVTATCEAS